MPRGKHHNPLALSFHSHIGHGGSTFVRQEAGSILEVLFAFLEQLQSKSVNLSTRKQLDVILLVATDVGHRINRLR